MKRSLTIEVENPRFAAACAGWSVPVAGDRRSVADTINREFPTLAAYVARGEARPAYGRAFAAQYAINGPQAS